MNKLAKRFLYWLGVGIAVLLFLFFLIPEPKDNPYMRIYSMSDGDDFSGCEFSDSKKSGGVFRFHMVPEDCRLVVYDGGGVLTMSVEYPSMKLVGAQVGDSIITFRMFHVSIPPYDTMAIFEGRSAIGTINGMKVYEIGSGVTFRFTGNDGVEVAVSEMSSNFIAKRLFDDLRISYQYQSIGNDLRKIDSFALSFLKRIMYGADKGK
ncbi:hypothetical protein ACYZT2_19595 [Pseudomonas sp. MDT1-85]